MCKDEWKNKHIHYMKILRQRLSRTKYRIGGVVSVDLCLPVRVVHEIDLMKVLKFD